MWKTSYADGVLPEGNLPSEYYLPCLVLHLSQLTKRGLAIVMKISINKRGGTAEGSIAQPNSRYKLLLK